MGKISDHFRTEDFKCRCGKCDRSDFKFHLGLVGILEHISENFKKNIKVESGYWCGKFFASLNKNKKTYHTVGKAVHISIEGVEPKELFRFVETISEINGIGFYPKESFIHIDTRPAEKRELWVKEGDNYHHLTSDKRAQYGL